MLYAYLKEEPVFVIRNEKDQLAAICFSENNAEIICTALENKDAPNHAAAPGADNTRGEKHLCLTCLRLECTDGGIITKCGYYAPHISSTVGMQSRQPTLEIEAHKPGTNVPSMHKKLAEGETCPLWKMGLQCRAGNPTDCAETACDYDYYLKGKRAMMRKAK